MFAFFSYLQTEKPNLSIHLSSDYQVPAWYESLEMRLSPYWPLKLITSIQDLLLKSLDFESHYVFFYKGIALEKQEARGWSALNPVRHPESSSFI